MLTYPTDVSHLRAKLVTCPNIVGTNTAADTRRQPGPQGVIVVSMRADDRQLRRDRKGRHGWRTTTQ